MHLSTVCQLALPAYDGGRKAGRHRDRIVINGHGLPVREQSDNGRVRPIVCRASPPPSTSTLVRLGGGRGRRSEIDQISVKAFAVAPRWIVYGVTLFVLSIAATSPCRDFEIIPATSSCVCCGDDVATFRVAMRALESSNLLIPIIQYRDYTILWNLNLN